MATIENTLGYFSGATPVLISGGGLFFTAWLIHMLKRPAERVGLVDRPGGRKTHEGLIPLTGGLAIYGSFFAMSECATDIVSPILLSGMGFVLAVGILDDLYGLSARLRLATEISAAVIMAVWGGQMIYDLGDIVGTGSLPLGFFALPFTVLCTVGFINAFNMADGIDGLASGCALTTVGWFIVATGLHGLPVPASQWTLLAAILGFMLYNSRHPLRKKASVFLGDSGSMLLGFTLAWFAIQITGGASPILSPIAVAWVLALPVIDTIRLMIQRVSRGCSPFVGDREHLHHILLRMNLTHGQTAWLLVGVNAALGGIGVIGHHFGIPDLGLTLGFVGILLIHYRWTTYACLIPEKSGLIPPPSPTDLAALSLRKPYQPTDTELPGKLGKNSSTSYRRQARRR